MDGTPSELLQSAMASGEIDNLEVKRIEWKEPEEFAKRTGRVTSTNYQARIYYTPVELTETRVFKPAVVCFSQVDEPNWDACDEESWITLETAWMPRPIRFGGDLSDAEVKQIYAAVDKLELVSRTDNQLVTSDKISVIRKHAQKGNRVDVYVTTAKKGYSDIVYLAKTDLGGGVSSFALSEFICGAD